MRFLLFDREENYLKNLSDVIEAKHVEEINGESTLQITTLDQNIIKEFKVAYKSNMGLWHEFIVKEIEKAHTDEGIEVTLFCESSFYETIGDYIEDKRPQNTTATGALMTALEPTRWEVGIVDDLGINSTNFYHVSAKEAVQNIAKTWKGEIRTRAVVSGNKITRRYVDLLANRGGDYGKRFTHTKDLESVTKTIHREDVITALYGYGKGEEVGDGYGRRIDFADINNGKAYVENIEARDIWGRPNGYGTKSHVFSKIEFDDCEDKEELLQLTTEKLEELSKPLITYEAKVIDLGGAELGDTVAVIDKEFNPPLRLKARVVKIVRDLLEEENNDIILGNFIPNISDFLNEQQKYIDNFRDKQGVWDRSQIIGNDGTINAQFLNNLVDELNNKMNSLGGYVYLSEDGKGLTTYDKPIDQNPTMAIQLLGGAFRIANSKNPDGEFRWRTFGDGNGFIADSFVGGLLKGGKVHFDLTNGTLLIGNSTEDYKLWFDGDNLHIKLGDKTIEETIVEIKQDAADIASDVKIVKQSITDANSDIDIMKNQIALKVEQEDIDKITIGGRNLLLYSQNDIEFFPNSEGTGTAKLMHDENIPYYRVNGTLPIDIHFGTPDSRFTEPLDTLSDVTVGFEVRTATNASVSLEGDVFETMAGRWTKVYITKEFSVNNTKSTRVLTPCSRRQVRVLDIQTKLIEEFKANVTQLDYRNLQFEKGTKATDHQIAPIETITNIESNKASITILADSISQKVTKNELKAELKLEADNLNIRFESGDFPLQGKNYRFDRENFKIGGTSGDVAEHDERKSKWLHEDGSYTQVSAEGFKRYVAGTGKTYHFMTKVIRFSAGGDNQAPATRWIPIGAEFNDLDWSAALSISDSMDASSSQAAIHRIVLTQAVDSNGNTVQPRFSGGQWEFPVMGYKTNVNAIEDTRRYGPIAGIMIVTA